MGSVRCHNEIYVQKVERGSSLPKCLTSSEKIAGYSLIKLPLHSEMADTNSKTYKATFSVMAHNLCIKPFLSQAPEDSSALRKAANHTTHYRGMTFSAIQCEKNKTHSLVYKERGFWKQQPNLEHIGRSYHLPTREPLLLAVCGPDSAIDNQYLKRNGPQGPLLCSLLPSRTYSNCIYSLSQADNRERGFWNCAQ